MSEVDDVPVSAENVSQQVHVTEPAIAAAADTPETLGVDQASYDKYYKGDTFDWASYGKEQAFKAQKATPTDEPVETPEAEDASGVVEKAGLDWDDLGAKISADGDISAEDYDALAAIGIPKQVISDYVASVQGNAQATIDAVIDMAGGQDAFDQLYTALYSNATEAARNKIDVLLRDPDTREAGVIQAYRTAGLEPPTGQYQTHATPTPAASRGNAPPVNRSVVGYDSQEAQVLDQRDPRYRTDPTFRAEVMQRIAASTYAMNTRTAGAGM